MHMLIEDNVRLLIFKENKSTIDEHRHTSQTFRSPCAATELTAEYQEWPFQGFLQWTKIGDDITYNLEFKLPPISDHLNLLVNTKTFTICSSNLSQSCSIF